jgi:hypothetical protein
MATDLIDTSPYKDLTWLKEKYASALQGSPAPKVASPEKKESKPPTPARGAPPSKKAE